MVLFHATKKRETFSFNFVRRVFRRRKIVIRDLDLGYEVRIQLYDDGNFANAKDAVNRSSLCFVYTTKNICDDAVVMHYVESGITVSLQAGEFKFVPVFTEKRDTTFRVPFAMVAMKGVRYYLNDRYYRAGVSALMREAVRKRVAESRRLEDTGLRSSTLSEQRNTARRHIQKLKGLNVIDERTNDEKLQCKICYENKTNVVPDRRTHSSGGQSNSTVPT